MHTPEPLLNDSSFQASIRRRPKSMQSADVSCSWLMMNSTSGRTVHFTLSPIYPEIHGLSTAPFCLYSRTLAQNKQLLQRSAELRLHSWFSDINTNFHARNLSFLT